MVLLLLLFAALTSAFNPCKGSRKSSDAIIVLGQKKHSSYDSTHSTSLAPILLSLDAYYPAVHEADVLVWHEGDLSENDVPQNLNFSVRLCDLWLTHGAWGPPLMLSDNGAGSWSFGYKFMIRFYAVTVWKLLDRLGYKWMVRFDDDSEIHSLIPYNMFEFMRGKQKLYGFRQYSEECGYDEGQFSDFVGDYFNKHHGFKFSKYEYCNGLGKYGYYNNFYITELKWWLSKDVQRFLTAFDESHYIFIHRHNDLILQTAAVKLLMAAEKRYHFIDWSYHHHTIHGGKVDYGGIDIGVDDTNGEETLRKYLSRYSLSEARVFGCEVEHESCPSTKSYPLGACEIIQTRVGRASACLPLENSILISTPMLFFLCGILLLIITPALSRMKCFRGRSSEKSSAI